MIKNYFYDIRIFTNIISLLNNDEKVKDTNDQKVRAI